MSDDPITLTLDAGTAALVLDALKWVLDFGVPPFEKGRASRAVLVGVQQALLAQFSLTDFTPPPCRGTGPPLCHNRGQAPEAGEEGR